MRSLSAEFDRQSSGYCRQNRTCWKGASVGPDSMTGVRILALKLIILVRAPAPPCGNTIAKAVSNISDERPIIRHHPIEVERLMLNAAQRSIVAGRWFGCRTIKTP